MTEYHPNFPEVQIKRQNRKSMALKVTPAGKFILHLPPWLKATHPDVKKFVRDGMKKLKKASTPIPKKAQHDEIIVRSMVEMWALKIGVRPARVQLRDMTRKWGSCSSKGTITLNTALLYVPIELVEYVIVHELVHMIHLNHSPEFWAKLGHFLPDYAKRERALEQYRVW